MTERPQQFTNHDIFSPEFLEKNYRNFVRAIQKLRSDINWNSSENREKLKVVRGNLQKLPLFHRSAVTNYHSHPSPSIALQETGVLSYARLDTFQKDFFRTATLTEDVVAKRDDYVFLSLGKPYVASAYDTADEFYWFVCDTAKIFAKQGVVVQDISVAAKLGLYTMNVLEEELLPETELLESLDDKEEFVYDDEGEDDFDDEEFADEVEKLSNGNFSSEETEGGIKLTEFVSPINYHNSEEHLDVEFDGKSFMEEFEKRSNDGSWKQAKIKELNDTSLTGEKYLNILALAIVADIITPQDIRSEVMIPSKLDYSNISLILETYSSDHDYSSTKAIEHRTILKSLADIDYARQRQDGYVSEIRVSPLLIESIAPSLHSLTVADLADTKLENWYQRAAQKAIKDRGLDSL